MAKDEFWKEYYVYSAEFLPLGAGTGVTFTDVEMRLDTDADFEFIKTIFQPVTARYRVRYRDDTSGRFLQKASQDIRTIGGTSIYSMAPGNPTPPGFKPFIWPKPYRIAAATTLTVQAADFSGLAYNTRLSFHGNKVRVGKAPWDQQWHNVVPFVYSLGTTGTVTVAANSTVSVSIPTDMDAPFLAQMLTGSRTGQCLVTIRDGARDRQWMNIPQDFDNFVGNGQFPNVFSSPRYISKGAVMAVTIQDLSGAQNTVEINIAGVKLYG